MATFVRSSIVRIDGQRRAGVDDMTPNTSPDCGVQDASGSAWKASCAMLASTDLHAWPGRYQSPAPAYQRPSMLTMIHWFPSTIGPGSSKNGPAGHAPSREWKMHYCPSRT